MLPEAKFLLKRIYGLEDVGWRIPRWLFSDRQSLICKWYDFSYFQTSMLHKTFHQVFAQEDIWFGRRCWLKNSKMTVVLGNLWYANGMICYFWGSCCLKPSIKFLLKRIYGLEEDVGWRIQKWLFSARQSLICKWDDYSYFWGSCCPKPSIKFLLKRIYGLEEMLVEEFQDGCLVLGNLWYTNGMI